MFIALILILILFVSIVFHEYAHAKVADMLGDDTPRLAGRLTINPVPHIDPLGAILPLLLIFSRSPLVFGWAKPVPINPNNFKDPQTGSMLVSIAGPASNFFLAWLAAVIYRFFPIHAFGMNMFVGDFVQLNVALGVFNLIPVPPLDGSHLLERYLPPDVSEILYNYGYVILFALLLFPGTSFILFSIIQTISGLLLPTI